MDFPAPVREISSRQPAAKSLRKYWFFCSGSVKLSREIARCQGISEVPSDSSCKLPALSAIEPNFVY
jgi:hypothetical protein